MKAEIKTMIKVELELNERTLEQARTHAMHRHISVERLFTDILEKQVPNLHNSGTSLGLFSDEPEMMDQVMEMVRAEREKPVAEPDNAIE